MAKLEPVCWVQLDDDDLDYLSREHDLESACKTVRDPRRNAEEQIVAKVYLGASGHNGILMENKPRPIRGALQAVGVLILLYFCIYGLVDAAFTIFS